MVKLKSDKVSPELGSQQGVFIQYASHFRSFCDVLSLKNLRFQGSFGVHSIMQAKRFFVEKNRVVNGFGSVEKTTHIRTEKIFLGIFWRHGSLC